MQPSFGVKQGCPLSPLLFAIYLNDIDSMADGVRGTLTGTPSFLAPHMLFADDLSLISNDPNHMQTMLNKLQTYAQRVSHDNTRKSEVMCFNYHTNHLHPSFMLARSSPTQLQNLGMVCDRHINLYTAADAVLCLFTAGIFGIKQFISH